MSEKKVKSIRKKIDKNTLIHVFDLFYVGCDSMNMIVYKENKSGDDYVPVAFHISGKSLLSGLKRLYTLECIKDRSILMEDGYLAVESFIEKIVDIQARFDSSYDKFREVIK